MYINKLFFFKSVHAACTLFYFVAKMQIIVYTYIQNALIE